MNKLLMGLLLVVALGGNAQAFERVSTEKLVEWCSTKDNSNIALCSAYFMGYLDFNRYETIKKICIPYTVKNWDVVKAFLSYMEFRPTKKSYTASYIIQKAIDAKWPCENIIRNGDD